LQITREIDEKVVVTIDPQPRMFRNFSSNFTNTKIALEKLM